MKVLVLVLLWTIVPSPTVVAEGESDPRWKTRIEVLRRLDPALYRGSESVRGLVDATLEALEGRRELVGLAVRFDAVDRMDSVIGVLEKFPDHAEATGALAWLLESGAAATLSRRVEGRPESALLDLLSRNGSSRALDITIPFLFGEHSAAARRLLNPVCLGKEGARRVLDELGKRPFAEVRPLMVEVRIILRQTPWREIREGLEALFPEGERREIGGEFDIAELVRLPGDAGRGKAVFRNPAHTCTLCHRDGEAGTNVGPDLAEIGRKLGKGALYDAILDPDAGISVGFETWEVTTRDGTEHIGILISDEERGVTLRNLLGDPVFVIREAIHDQRQLSTSLMPEGLGVAIGRENLVDLVAYLSRLGH